MLVELMAAAVLAQQQPTDDLLGRRRPDQRPPAAAPPGRQRRGSVAVQSEGREERIARIQFEGADAPAAVAETAQAYIGKPATRETLTELAGALSQAYERTNVALYSVSIPEQDFSGGVVRVALTEGWIEEVQVTGDADDFPLLRRRAQKLVGEKPLSRARLQRQTALIQAIPGLTFESSFENPEGDDSVRLLISPKQRRVQAAFGINNRGPSLLGDLVLNLGVDAYKVLTDGDQLSFTASATPKIKHYRLLESAYAVPIGADGLTLTGTLAFLRTRARDFDISGRAKLAGLTLSYALLRRDEQAADVSFGIDGINSDNAAFGNVIASDRTRAARLAGTFVDANSKHKLTLTGVASRGLDIFDARTTLGLAEVTFSKFAASGTYERSLAARLLGRAHVVAQITGDRLPAAELFSVGGATIGRAFDTGFLTGDRGRGGFVELAYRPIREERFKDSEMYLFADAADLTVKARGPFPSQQFDMASAGLGVRGRYKNKVQLGLEGAAVLDKPFPTYTRDWRLSFNYSILF
jgi:hemolysin activation/secretion protein